MNALTTLLNTIAIIFLGLSSVNLTNTLVDNSRTSQVKIRTLQDKVDDLMLEAMKNKKVVYYEVDGKKGTIILPADVTDEYTALKIKEVVREAQ